MAFVTNYNNGIDIIEQDGDDLFLDLVKSRPWLYDKSNNGYGDKIMTHNAWVDISKVINQPVEQCIKHWDRMKNNYHKESMLREKEMKSGSAKSKRKSWSLYDRMKHLFETEQRVRKTYSNVPFSGINQTFKTPSSKIKKVKRQPNFLNSVITAFSENTDKLLSKVSQNETVSSHLSTNDSNEIFGLLVAVELDNMTEECSSKKRKLIYKYISENT